MSDMMKYVKLIENAEKPVEKKKRLAENAKKGDMVKSKHGYAKVVKEFDDGYMIKYNESGETAEVDTDEVEVVDLKRDIGRGTIVKHARGLAKIVKVFDDGYMIKFQDDNNTEEVEFDEVLPLK